jgi:hypothetical protein
VAAQTTDAFAATPTNADLIERINRAWPTLEGTLAGSDEAALTTPGGDGWSVKDHLAHLEAWERYLLALLERRSPSAAIGIDLATYRATDDDTLNELIREPTKAQPLSQVLADLRRTHERLLAVVAAVPEHDLERLAAHYQPVELADDTDTIAVWIAHICVDGAGPAVSPRSRAGPAAASSAARSSSPSARPSASMRTVSNRGAGCNPRSRSLMPLRLSPARSARSSWDSPAALRNWRSRSPNGVLV